MDTASVQDVIAEVAAAEIMPRFRRLAATDIHMKGVNDPVTVADRAMEAALTKRLTAAFPGSVVIGEERFAEDPAILSRFDGEADVWVVDPIDGTRNFIAGKPEFGVMVALVRRRKTIAAWIHDPSSGDTLMAERGGGVWLRGEKLRLAGRDASVPQVCLVGPRLKEKLSRPELAEVSRQLPSLEAASAAAFDYGRLFTGDVLFAGGGASRVAYLLFRQSKPWDHVPGLLMLAEAGGYAADFSGKPYDMRAGQGGLLIAPDRASWRTVFDVFEPFVNKRSAA